MSGIITAVRATALAPLVGLVVALTAASAPATPGDPSDGRPPVSASVVTSGPVPSAGRWGWPLTPTPAILERFAPPEHEWSPGHRGVDLAAAVGARVLAPEVGVVTFAGEIAGRGVVVVSHPGGLRSTFEPVEQSPPVGAAVVRGQPIGTVSTTPGHCSPATCIHWGVLRGGTYLDPLGLVGLLRVVLLPLR